MGNYLVFGKYEVIQILQEDKARWVNTICWQYRKKKAMEATCRAGFISAPYSFSVKPID
jgi:hypothetical protein